jgi:carboxynorspermidine decarboxylase
MTLLDFSTIHTPAYVTDLAVIRRNMEVVTQLKAATGVKVLLALKAFSQFSAFAPMQEALDGVTSSGIYEARLGKEHFGGEVHVYSPAYRDWEIEELLTVADHLTFNSLSQLEKYGAKVAAAGIHIGLRLNPEVSFSDTPIYDPCGPCSRLGMRVQSSEFRVPEAVSLLHVHALCQNLAEDSAKLIDTVMEKFGGLLAQVESLNIGGGHYLNDPKYDLDVLVVALNRLKAAHPHLTVYLEPGGALVYNAGYLVASVLDIIEGAQRIAILDTSATAHMPDVIEMPYRPDIIGGDLPNVKAHTYLLGAPTCLAGDVIGEYSFDAPLKVGDKLIFTDMAQYSMVKNTTFNGIPLPDVAVLHEDGRYEVVKRFGYEDFLGRVS